MEKLLTSYYLKFVVLRMQPNLPLHSDTFPISLFLTYSGVRGYILCVTLRLPIGPSGRTNQAMPQYNSDQSHLRVKQTNDVRQERKKKVPPVAVFMFCNCHPAFD